MLDNGNSVRRVHELRERLKAKRDSLSSNLAKVEEELLAVSKTLDLLEEKRTRISPGQRINLGVRPEELNGMTQLQAVIHIALKNNGLLKVSPVRRLLVQSGLLGSGKNASRILYSAIDRSGKFESVKRGEYQLAEYPTT